MNDTSEICSLTEVLISYDKDTNRFSVKSAETQSGYFVPRGDLVGDYRSFGAVLKQILDGCNQLIIAIWGEDYHKFDEVLKQLLDDYNQLTIAILDEAANSEINLIWDANIILF